MAIGTAECKDNMLVGIKKTADDHYITGFDLSTTSDTFVDLATLSFTPATAGDYLILAMASAGKSETTRGFDLQLWDGSTAYGNTTQKVLHANHRLPWGTFTKQTLSASAQSWSIQGQRLSLGTLIINWHAIVALRLDNFTSYFYAESLGASTTTSTSFVDKTTLTATPNSGSYDHLVLSCSNGTDSSNAASVSMNVIQNSTSIVETLNEPVTATNIFYPSWCATTRSQTGSTTTWKTQFHGEAGDTGTIQDSKICVIQLNNNATVWVKGANIFGATIF